MWRLWPPLCPLAWWRPWSACPERVCWWHHEGRGGVPWVCPLPVLLISAARARTTDEGQGEEPLGELSEPGELRIIYVLKYIWSSFQMPLTKSCIISFRHWNFLIHRSSVISTRAWLRESSLSMTSFVVYKFKFGWPRGKKQVFYVAFLA